MLSTNDRSILNKSINDFFSTVDTTLPIKTETKRKPIDTDQNFFET